MHPYIVASLTTVYIQFPMYRSFVITQDSRRFPPYRPSTSNSTSYNFRSSLIFSHYLTLSLKLIDSIQKIDLTPGVHFHHFLLNFKTHILKTPSSLLPVFNTHFFTIPSSFLPSSKHTHTHVHQFFNVIISVVHRIKHNTTYRRIVCSGSMS